MNIISYNVNGIRAAAKKGFIEWLVESGADVVCIQETKAQADQIPVLELKYAGYDYYGLSAQKKGYSGVAILSKTKPDNVVYGMGIEKYDNEGRFIRADYGDLSIVSVYHPSGTSGEERQAFKMQWLDDFQEYVHRLQKERPNLVLCGDYNICHRPIDIHDPIRNANSSGFLPEEREWIDGFIKSGFTDSFRHVNGDKKDSYSWWSYRANARANNKGWRIDYCMVSDNIKNRISDAGIIPSAMHSDHCPISLKLD
ncbi:MAG: exodeoxyribonuclease III [Bacteroidales bacterium]|nr:exodeoxyribonuclease III [Bacteroidales bacterium]